MKIYDDDINTCSDCKYWDGDYQWCNKQHKELPCGWDDDKFKILFDSNEQIHEDCPFAQPITKEYFLELLKEKYVTSGLFESIELIDGESYFHFDLRNGKEELLRFDYAPIPDENCMGIAVNEYSYYGGVENKYKIHEQIKVHNPVHLKFILSII